MPRALEQKLKKEYGANSEVPYKIMNKLGLLKHQIKTKMNAKERHDAYADR